MKSQAELLLLKPRGVGEIYLSQGGNPKQQHISIARGCRMMNSLGKYCTYSNMFKPAPTIYPEQTTQVSNRRHKNLDCSVDRNSRSKLLNLIGFFSIFCGATAGGES